MFCMHCGVQIPAEAQFCSSCGKAQGPVGAPVAAGPPRSRLQTHLQLLAILWIAYAVLKFLSAAGMFFAGGIIMRHVHMPPEAGFVPGLLSMFGWGFLISAVIGIAAGWGLLQKQPWARLLAIVLSFIALFNVPFGTALGVYTLWVLLPQESAREYEQAARA
ncbi:zinc ribbon domain-containing protein [Acidobacteriia bacterium AH_259_A11_L15]|nr:zinc ribbon domain-containing protein [Acidobacteriia bacterium AH_259_A11_L15]